MKRGASSWKEPAPSPRWRERLRRRPCASAAAGAEQSSQSADKSLQVAAAHTTQPSSKNLPDKSKAASSVNEGESTKKDDSEAEQFENATTRIFVELEALSGRLATRFTTFHRLFLKDVLCGSQENAAVSPLSCLLPLAMVHAGACGETAAVLSEVLGFPPNDKNANEDFKQLLKTFTSFFDGELIIANRAFVAKRFAVKRAYASVLRDVFDSSLVKVDFIDQNTSTLINEWIAQQTKGKINNVVTPDVLNDQTRLVLVNAVYFNGQWEQPFLKQHTTKETFHTSLSQTVEVFFMKNRGYFPYADLEDLEAQLISLPYQGQGNLRMVIVLPKQIDGLAKLQQQLATKDLRDLLKKRSYEYVNLSLPKFKFEATIQLKQKLTKMGLGQIFTNKANLSAVSSAGEPLKVSDVFQKVFIEIDEHGTEAAAATAVLCTPGAHEPWVEPKLFTVKCDHPFLFYIALGHATIVFAGHIARPSPSA